MEHTKTPWARPWRMELSHNKVDYNILMRDNGWPVAHHVFEANAQFIVKAVNNYDKLVSMIKWALGVMENRELLSTSSLSLEKIALKQYLAELEE